MQHYLTFICRDTIIPADYPHSHCHIPHAVLEGHGVVPHDTMVTGPDTMRGHPGKGDKTIVAANPTCNRCNLYVARTGYTCSQLVCQCRDTKKRPVDRAKQARYREAKKVIAAVLAESA